MIARITLKRLVKQTAGWASVLMSPFHERQAHTACILVYHRLAVEPFRDSTLDSWNVPPSIFERQIAGLASTAEFVGLDELPARLTQPSGPRPLVCLTFDDGYANFFTRALPVLARYHARATVFVVTGCIGLEQPMPFDRWGNRHARRAGDEAWRPMNWHEIEACVASGLVTVGAHSQRHLNAVETRAEDLAAEAGQSRALLLERLGEDHAFAYSYPYGSTRLGQVTPAYVDAVRRAGYRMAVSTDLGLAGRSSDPFVLPRVEAHATDSPAVLHAKVCGSLVALRVTDQLRTARRTG